MRELGYTHLMLRIVGLHRGTDAADEFVLLQNQGSIRVRLKGHAIMTESKFLAQASSEGSFAFTDEEFVPAGHFVLLRSGTGEPRWGFSKDGSRVFFTFAAAPRPLWPESAGSLHVLHIQHTYVERKPSPIPIE